MENIENNFCFRSLISVIMPVYNSEKYVSDSIRSILNQTFYNFEFIIVDDCSTDNTWEIIQSFYDNRIISIRNKKNLGNYPSRNIGMKKASGKYIAVMDGDDIAMPTRLWKQFDYLEKNSEILALGTQFDFIGLDFIKSNPTCYNKICAGLLDNNCVLHPSLLIRTKIMRQLNGYNEDYKSSSDYDLVCRISLLGKIENLSDTCILYRWHPDQISHKKTLEQKEFADDIRQKYQIAFINKNKSVELSDISDNETGHPDIGRVIGLYIMSKCLDKSYQEEADKLLDYILENVNLSMPLSVKNGLLGIGLGLIYLIRNNLVEGDEDDVLESIDVAVFHSIIYFQENHNFDWEGTFCYLLKRGLMNNSKNLIVRLKIKKTILHLIDNYKRCKNSNNLDSNIRIKKELDILCDNNLFKSLILNIQVEGCNKKVLRNRKIKSDSATFVIPIRIDSEERYNNLLTIIDSLLSINNSKIIILEADTSTKIEIKGFSSRVTHVLVIDCNPVFHRTKYINQLLKIAETHIVGVWDADVIASKEQIEESIMQIKEENAIISFPYDGRFFFLTSDLSDAFRKKSDFNIFEEQKNKLSLSFGTYSVGGAFIVNKEAYCLIGGENESFYGWGAEDNERVKRMEVLGYNIHRTNGALYHLYHPRNNSVYADKEVELNSLKELIKVSNMHSEELMNYIKTWNNTI